MLRWLRKRSRSIHTSQPANELNASRLIHSLIGWDVPPDASFLEDEDIALYTTIHQAMSIRHTTQPMKTEKREIA